MSKEAVEIDNSFWRYSLKLYAQPGVQQLCLGLQNQHGFDVNLLLFCCWLSQQGILIESSILQTVKQLADEWRIAQVEPIRLQRKALGKSQQAERQALLELELAAEKGQQAMMHQAYKAEFSLTKSETVNSELLSLNLAVLTSLYPSSSVNMSQESYPELYQAFNLKDF